MTIASLTREPVRQHNRQALSRSLVIADPETSASIYNGELKVIVAAEDLRSATEICGLGGRLAIYVCERSGRRGFEIYRAQAHRGAARITLNHPPTLCLALLALSSAGKRHLEALREAWSDGAEGFLPSATCIDHGDFRDAAAVHRMLFETIAEAYSSSAARLLALRRQYTAFRIVHDQLQNAFDTVENFLTRSQLPPIWL